MIQKKFFVNNLSFRMLKFVIALAILLPFVACNGGSDDEELVGNWVRLSSFDGNARAEAVVATVEDYAYVGTGYNGEDRLKDFWRYDPENNHWTRIADFGGSGRTGAVAFEAGGKLFVGTGYDGTNRLNDFWKYDPATDVWTQVSSFPGSERHGAVAFSIDGIGYVGTGFDGNYLKDFYSYNPATDEWNIVLGYSGEKRRDAMAFVIDGKAYVVGGLNSGTFENDFYSYDPTSGTSGTWTKLAKISDATSESFDDEYSIVRNNGVAFVMNGKGYITTGGKSSTGTDVWEYNPTTDRWQEKQEFEGAARMESVAFSINDIGYLALGRNSGYYFDDLYRFEPNSEYNEED
ncbi:Kelch repeat-containing protein [Gaoshiqia sediminis]|uniref:Galactose oxidase n=1 Tax=Gaoshiqia sediminis TaxID=2986998 RepID=A0AA42C4T5_9BACT|nr:kelch repeat-containing protein [Gaoshiqia sediminis]MCW0482118.1 galactose oxidase [Gaoshiqia sediminis]